HPPVPDLLAVPPPDPVATGTAVEAVVAVPADPLLLPGPTEDGIVPGPAVDAVVAAAAADRVVPALSVDRDVVGGEGHDHVGAVGARDGAVGGRSGDRGGLAVGCHRTCGGGGW